MKRFLCQAVALGVLLSAVRMTKADYTFTTLDVPGSTGTMAGGVNDSGQIVGSYTDASGKGHGFLLSGGQYTTLDVPGSSLTSALGINVSGQVVGFYNDASRKGHGFLLSGGQYTTLDPPDSLGTQAFGINNAGQIVGVYRIGVTDRGFLLSGGVYTMVAPPASVENGASGINASAQTVGGYRDRFGVPHGFLFSSGNYATLDVPGSTSTTASGINDTGEIVGNYFAGGRLHGFVLSGGSYTTVDVLGSVQTFASGINASGQVVGNYTDANGVSHGFLATPVVTPATTFAWHGPTMTIATNATGNPSFVQAIPGTYGTKGNYELVVPLQSGGIGHFFRNNDDPTLPWSGPFTFASDQGIVDSVSLIQSNFSTQFVSTGTQGPGNLAVVERTGTQLNYFFREDVTFTWSGPTSITSGVSGVPSFVQARPGTFGVKGNYELVTPLATGGMAHFFRDNDNPSLPWSETATFGTDQGVIDAVSLIQSNFSTQFVETGVQGPGNLAVVGRVGSNLLYFYRDDVAPFAWHGPTMTIATGVTGNPSFVQAIPGTFGSTGNYELVTPLATGGMAHFFRNNDDPTLPWTQTATFGTMLGIVNGVSLIQSNFSTAGNGPGNLAVVSVANSQADYFYRDDR